jgi:aspartate kinase
VLKDNSNCSIVVQKYGGSSVSTPERIKQVAQLIKNSCDAGNKLCIVVSAMGKTTDQLLAMAKEITQNPSRRELDMLLSCGERASMALLAMALHEKGVPSISLTGSQSGIITDDVHSGARIIEVRPHRVQSELGLGKVVIVAGFQGISFKKEITTLGRGGSDTTAIALAAALDATACEIYSDVAGVYTADPKVVSGAQLLDIVSFEEMEILASLGAKVLNQDAVSFAKQRGVTIFARKTGDAHCETIIKDVSAKSHKAFLAIAHQPCLLRLRAKHMQHLSALLKALSLAGIASTQVFSACEQNVERKPFWCFMPLIDAHGIESMLKDLPDIKADKDFGTVSFIGRGVLAAPYLLAKALEILKNDHIKVAGLYANSQQASLALLKNDVLNAAQILHDGFLEEK